MTPHRAELIRRVDALHTVELGTRLWLPRICPSALAAEVERQAARVLWRHLEPQRSHLLEIARRTATWAASREPSDAVCAAYGLEVAISKLLGVTVDDEPATVWRNGRPLPEWGSRCPVYPRPTRAQMRNRMASLIGSAHAIVPANLERLVQTVKGSASVEHYGDGVRPSLDALALAAAWLSSTNGSVIGVELGTQAAIETLSTMAGDRTIVGVSRVWQAGSNANAEAAIVNFPTARQFAWHHALARVAELPGSIRHTLRHIACEKNDDYQAELIDLLDEHLLPGGAVVVMADPKGGLHHRAVDHLLARGYEPTPVNGADTVASPVWVSITHRPWSPVGGPTVTGRLLSMLRRGP